MRVAETLKSIGRRWYIVVVGLLLTAGLAWTVNTQVPTSYDSKGSILIMPPEFTVGKDGNPYLFLGGMNQAVDVLVRRASAMEVTAPLLAQHPGASYTIAADGTTSSPILVVTATAPTPDGSLQTLDAALKSVDAMLSTMQDESSVKDINRVHGQELVVDETATPKTKTKLQLMLMAVGVGLIGTVWLAGLMDGWIISRKQRKSTTPEAETAPETPAVPSGQKGKRGRASVATAHSRAPTAVHGPPQDAKPPMPAATEEPAKTALTVR